MSAPDFNAALKAIGMKVVDADSPRYVFEQGTCPDCRVTLNVEDATQSPLNITLAPCAAHREAVYAALRDIELARR